MLHQEPDSPCVGLCTTLFDPVCKGCGRTAKEVSEWVFMSAEAKQAVWERLRSENLVQRFQTKS